MRYLPHRFVRVLCKNHFAADNFLNRSAFAVTTRVTLDSPIIVDLLGSFTQQEEQIFK